MLNVDKRISHITLKIPTTKPDEPKSFNWIPSVARFFSSKVGGGARIFTFIFELTAMLRFLKVTSRAHNTIFSARALIISVARNFSAPALKSALIVGSNKLGFGEHRVFTVRRAVKKNKKRVEKPGKRNTLESLFCFCFFIFLQWGWSK